MKLNYKINEVFKHIKNMSGDSPDLNTRIINIGYKKIGYIFLESVSSDDKISNYLVKSIVNITKHTSIFDDLFKNLYKELNNNIFNSKIMKVTNYEDAYYYLASGFTIVFINGIDKGIAIETKETLDRGVSEAVTEITIKGPKDAFTENYNKNIGLIRKRIKDSKLRFKEQIVGKRSKTKLSISYIDDIVDKSRLNTIENKIKKINIDGVLDVGYIRDYLVPDNMSSFPTVICTERPDLVSAALLEGKIAIILENTPNVMVIPATINNFIHNPEDSYQKAVNITLTRTLRFLALIITILTPALYVAITTFNQEVIPDTLLISLAIQRSGVPFPTTLAILILMVTFEILRESDMRLPESMGTSISIVGALVLGDAAVNAGLVSPIVVIIVAITSITGLLFTDLDIVNAFRLWRLIFLLFASIMGIIGIVVVGLIFISKLSSIDSFGISYLLPYSPFNKASLSEGIITKSHNKMFKRPNYLTNNETRMRDNNEN